ncbi:carbamate kinase, partial [bacterium]|nr:carbamate kinase [bacterium]
NFGTPQQKDIPEMTANEAQKLYDEGHFPPGSMGPKIESAIYFLKNGGKEVIITSISQVEKALHGRGRFTKIVP